MSAETSSVAPLAGPAGLNLSDDDGPMDRSMHYPRGATLFAAVCCVLFIVVGVIGNLVTMVALCRSLRLPARPSGAATVFILSLCASDLLFCSVNLPLTASRYIHEAWLMGETACRLFPFFFYGNVATSLFSMVAIAVNRYILISHNRLYGKIYRPPYVAGMVLAVWFISFALLLPPLTGTWGRMGLNRSTFSCTILEKDGSSPKKVLFALGILLPCVVITVCYLLIFFRARRHRTTMRNHRTMKSPNSEFPPQASQRQNLARKEDRRLTKMMLTVFVAFFVCFFPLMLVNVFDGDDVRLPVLHVIASVLAWMSAVINPFIYVVSSRYYRALYRQLLCCCRPGADRDDVARSDDGATVATDAFPLNAV